MPEMIDFKEIKKKHGGMLCRACLIVEYDVKLNPDDCIYQKGRKYCARCQCYKHIVERLSFSGKMKTLFK